MSVSGVQQVQVNYDEALACIDVERPIEADTLTAALATENYSLGAIQSVDSCPQTPTIHPKDPWARTDGVDASIISDGFEVKLTDHRVDGKFTIFDFGASWCGPCHVAADRLRELMKSTPDLAVRAISLGHDPKSSFEYPVVKQHMAFATGLPWFIVFSPTGKKIYEGNSLDKALRAIEKKR
jgi:thiol-disulfide isomerase/thioredoxin